MPLLECIAPLFVPASRPELLTKAAASGADTVILDLEDAVAPDRKDAARANLGAAGKDIPRIVRINPVGSPWYRQDVLAVRPLPFAAIMLPKADLNGVRSLARDVPQTPIVALIESARGLADARRIAMHPRVHRLAFGSLDYSVTIGASHSREALLAARCELVLASALAAILAPLDGVTLALKDATLTQSDACHAAELGFSGKLCVHPQQIEPVFRGFTPSDRDVAWARTMLSPAQGASQTAGMMVDAPVRLRAQAIIHRLDRTMTQQPRQDIDA